MRFVFWANHGVVHDAGVGIDAHALKYIEGAWHVVRRNIPPFHRRAQIFPTAVIGDLLCRVRIDINAFREHALRYPLSHHLETLPAAHPLLQIMAPFLERVLDNRQHRIVAFGIENISSADEDFHLICLRPRLIKPFGQIVQIKRNEIDDARPRDPQPPPFFDFKRCA